MTIPEQVNGGEAPVADEATKHHLGEPRAAMAIAVIATLLLHATLPHSLRDFPIWVYPTVVVGLLVVLIVGDPGRIDKRDTWLRVVNAILIAFISVTNAMSAVHLVRLIIENSVRVAAPDRLLGSGATIWLINVIAFGLWYWDLDQGGPAERANRTPRLPAFLFPEMTVPEFVQVGWFPSLVDYLHLSFATATSFGPSDVSAIKRWSKMLMTLEAAVSLALAVLVVARAINLLPVPPSVPLHRVHG